MRKQRFLQLILLLFFFTCLPALAAVDPEGVSFRDRLRGLVESGEQRAFKTLVQAEPALSKRAFVVEFLDVWEREANLTELAKLLSAEIGESHYDVKPAQICDRYQTGQSDIAGYELGRYAEDVYPAYEGTPTVKSLNVRNLVEGVHYGAGEERRADFNDVEFVIYLPEVLNNLRIHLAEAYLDPALFIQELELGSKALELRRSGLQEVLSESEMEEVREEDRETEEWMKTVGRIFLVQSGLSSDIDPDSLAAIETLAPKERLDFLFIRFQAAFRGHRLDDARTHLSAIEKLLSENSIERPPLKRFLLRTMQFQSRPDELSASQEEVLAAFALAWSELEQYEPGLSIPEDEDWWAAREAVRYWIDKLGMLDTAVSEAPLKTIFSDLIQWLAEALDTPVLEHYTTHEMWLQSSEIHVFLTQLISLTDLMSYCAETLGMERVFQAERVAEAMDVLEKTTLILEKYPEDFHFNYDNSPYPRLTFQDSALMRELKLRIAYLKAVTLVSGEKKQVEELLSIAPGLQRLERPESYIHYNQLFARAYQTRERSDLAVPLLEQALEKAEKYGFPKKEVELAKTLAEIYSARSDWEKAVSYSQRAKSTLQATLPTSPSGDADQLGRLGRDVGDLGAVAYLKSDNPKAAFEALSEGQQLESAATQLSANRKVRSDLNEVASKRRRLEILERQVQSVESLHESSTKTELLQTQQKLLAQTRSEFLLESQKIKARHPELYATTLRFDPLVLPDVQSGLPPEAAVVQYFSTAQELFIFVVTRDGFHLRSVSLKQSELDELILSYLKKLRVLTPYDESLANQSRRLNALLLGPIAEEVGQSEMLILIPSGRLNVLPFAALLDDSGTPLVARKRLVSLAKATDFMKIAGSQPKAVSGMVAFANATLDLPSAQKEGEKIKEIFPDTKLFVGSQATRDNLFKFASGADILHMATHGQFDPVDALNNYLALAESGRLTQEEIFNLELAETTLVTLSACNTALSSTTEYDFVASIAEAFWVAGSRSVVASVWSVDDVSTERLMTEFYRVLKEEGLGKAEALQKAQLAVRAEPRFEHPYYWAGFMLFGDYR